MDHYIECPVCEERFHVRVDDPNKQITCVGCSRKFLFSAAAKLQAPAPKAVGRDNRLAIPTKPVPSPTPTEGAKVQKSANPDEDLVLQPASETETVSLSGSGPLTSQGLLKRRRNKRKVIGALTTVLLLAAIIGILSGLLINQLMKNPLASAETETDPANKTSAPIDPKEPLFDAGLDIPNEVATDKGAAAPLKTKSTEPKRIRLEDLPTQEFFFHELRDVQKCWDLVQPHMLSLTVHDAYGTHEAVGTIVDSRGWIVTSYTAVKGASKIEVTQTVKVIDELPNDALLKDIVRGVIKIDPAQDIAILSINRRFITSFADISITDKNKVVEGEYLLQAAPPSTANLYGRSETKMQYCGRQDTLSEAGKAEIDKRKHIAPETQWIACPDKQNTLPGSPLARIEGVVEAINVFTHDDVAYYVPVHELKSMIAKAVDEVQPMSVLGGADLSSGPLALGTDHPARDASVSLNQLAQKCEDFQWIPSDKEQYDVLQSLAEELAKLVQFVKSNKESDPELAAQARVQVEQVKNSIAKSLTKMTPDKYASIRTLNKFASEELKTPGRAVPFFGDVFTVRVSHGHDFLGLTMTDTFVRLANDDTRENFAREAKCFAFIKTTGNVESVNYPIRDETIPATTVKLITRIDDKR